MISGEAMISRNLRYSSVDTVLKASIIVQTYPQSCMQAFPQEYRNVSFAQEEDVKHGLVFSLKRL